MTFQPLQSRFAGSMIGTFVGDALGNPFEGVPHDLIEVIENVEERDSYSI